MPGGVWGSFENMQRAGATAGAGTRTGSRIGQGSQHHPLLAANGGPLLRGDRGRRACYPDRSEPDADGNRGLQRACRVQDMDRACRGGVGASDAGGSAQSAQSLEVQPLPPHGLRFVAARAGPGRDRLPPAIAAIESGELGLAHWTYRMLAVAYARTGQIDEARRWLSAADRLWPYFTVRGVSPEELSSPVYVAADQRLSGRVASRRRARPRR